MPDSTAKVLSYGDVVLRQRDVDLLRGPHWLNDQLIEFYFEYLAAEAFAGAPGLAFLGPGRSFYAAKASPADAADALAGMHLVSKDLVLFAVNDNQDVGVAEGGCHWSLLVFDRRRSPRFRHFDSCPGMNHAAAEGLARAAAPLVGVDAEAEVESGDMARQGNAHDCGVYLMATAQAVCQAHMRGLADEELLGRLMRLRPGDMAGRRTELLDVILAKRRQAQ